MDSADLSGAVRKDDSELLLARVRVAVAERYDGLREIGRGGMAVVYAARDRRLNRDIALKVLPPELAFRSDVRERFVREAQTAAAMIPATFHSAICEDLDIFYTRETLAKVAAIVRQAKPRIVLTHALVDYMEDHQNAARLAVGGAFCRAMPIWLKSNARPAQLAVPVLACLPPTR